MQTPVSEAIQPGWHNRCPLCDGRILGGLPLPFIHRRFLYGERVCERCWRSFLARRFVGFLLDWLALTLLGAGIELAMPEVDLLNPGADLPSWTGLLVMTLIFSFKDGIVGVSPGRWLLGTRVIDRSTLRPSGPMHSFKRNFLIALPLVVFPFLGYALVAFLAYDIYQDGYRLWDGWANTRVVWRKHAHKPPFAPRGNLCLRCGYDLTGNVSGICPECGTEIPPEQRPDIPDVP